MKKKGKFNNSIDAVIILDAEGNLLECVNAEKRYINGKTIDYSDYIGQNLLEFCNIDRDSSTILRAAKEGKPVYGKRQSFGMEETELYCECLTIPVNIDGELRIIEITRYLDDNNQSKDRVNLQPMYRFENIITSDGTMRANIEKARLIKDSDMPVMIYGETGTGKELFAQALHSESARGGRPFIAQNCAALPETLFESILFGTVKGAYTGAVDKAGLLEIAGGGTLFLDEINSMPLSLQGKLLRAIEEKRIRRVGDTRDIEVDVRIITAMNEKPYDVLKKGHMREDLFYRLNVLNFGLVPLRDRKEDIALYADHFIRIYNEALGKNVEDISDSVREMFCGYRWPGNVREIKNVICAAMHFADGRFIEKHHLPDIFVEMTACDDENSLAPEDKFSIREKSAENEKEKILQALEKSGGNISRAARLLDMPRSTLQYKIEKYSMSGKESN